MGNSYMINGILTSACGTLPVVNGERKPMHQTDVVSCFSNKDSHVNSVVWNGFFFSVKTSLPLQTFLSNLVMHAKQSHCLISAVFVSDAGQQTIIKT